VRAGAAARRSALDDRDAHGPGIEPVHSFKSRPARVKIGKAPDGTARLLGDDEDLPSSAAFEHEAKESRGISLKKRPPGRGQRNKTPPGRQAPAFDQKGQRFRACPRGINVTTAHSGHATTAQFEFATAPLRPEPSPRNEWPRPVPDEAGRPPAHMGCPCCDRTRSQTEQH
jgi:hypothetical protein